MDELVAGRYRLEGELGHGGFATVFRAHDTQLDRPVALKVMSAAISSDAGFVARFEREGRLAARLDHRNIVTVHDIGMMPDGRPFISMRLLDGVPLDHLIHREGGLSADQAVAILSQVAEALDYVHQAGYVHRDIKPSNIMVDSQGRATLTDFGIAQALDAMRITMTGISIGTPRYMSPEQITGDAPTPASDIYALGCTAFEMLAGRPPFEGGGTSLLYRVVHEAPPRLTSFRSDLGEGVAVVIERALAKSPTERWKSASIFVGLLSGAIEAAGDAGKVVPPAVPIILQPLPPPPAAYSGATTIDRPASQPAGSPISGTSGVGPPPATPAPTSAGGAGSPSAMTNVLLAAGGAVALLAIVAGAFFFLRSGGDDDDDGARAKAAGATDTAASATPTASPTATRAAAVPTATPTGGWAAINRITQANGAYQVTFTTGGFTYPGNPTVGGDHVHFYWNTTPREQAGAPGAGPWYLYFGTSPVTLPSPFTVAEKPAGATQICILVATTDHRVKANTGGNCFNLP